MQYSMKPKSAGADTTFAERSFWALCMLPGAGAL
jgi:hypothetical protein